MFHLLRTLWELLLLLLSTIFSFCPCIVYELIINLLSFNFSEMKLLNEKWTFPIQSKVVSEALSIMPWVEFSEKNKCSNVGHESIFLWNNQSKLIHPRINYQWSMLMNTEHRTTEHWCQGFWWFCHDLLFNLKRPYMSISSIATSLLESNRSKNGNF